MQPISTLRTWHLEQLKKALDVYHYFAATISPHDASTFRDGGDGWTVLEVMGHLFDFEGVYKDRFRVTLETDGGELPFPDPEALVLEKRYNSANLLTLYHEWANARRELIALLETLTEEQWNREARHPKRDMMSATDQLMLMVWHDLNHLEQIAHILTTKLTSKN